MEFDCLLLNMKTKFREVKHLAERDVLNKLEGQR